MLHSSADDPLQRVHSTTHTPPPVWTYEENPWVLLCRGAVGSTLAGHELLTKLEEYWRRQRLREDVRLLLCGRHPL